MRKIQEYYKLKQQVKMLTQRLEQLNKEIKDEMLQSETFQLQTQGLIANLQVKRSKPQPDDAALEHLLIEKGLLQYAIKEVIDHDAVEEMFIKGELTDEDLRSIGAEPKVIMALTVEEFIDDV